MKYKNLQLKCIIFYLKVGEYDSDEGELWGSEGSGSDEEESWETQSSVPEPESRTPDKPADGGDNAAGELSTGKIP